MNVTRKTWVSAGIVSLVLAGGISVTAAAASGGIGGAEKPSDEPVPAVSPNEPGPPSYEPSPTVSTPPAEEYVISKEVNPDPGRVFGYWNESRLEQAEPFPMPMVDGPVEGSPGPAKEGPAEVIE